MNSNNIDHFLATDIGSQSVQPAAIPDCQRQRSLVFWHDHATILNHGFLMVTVHTLYDQAVHLTNQEYLNKTGKHLNVQAEVEQPEVYMLAMGSSSVNDQASVIADRVECLHDLQRPIKTSNGMLDDIWHAYYFVKIGI